MGKDLKDQTHLTKRGSVYYLRRRIPSDLLSRYGKAEIMRSLGTKDKAEATRKARLESVKLDQEFAQTRAALGAPPIAELTQEEIDRLAALFYARHMEADDEMRIRKLTDEELESWDGELADSEATFRRLLAKGDTSSFLPAVEDFLLLQGYDIKPGTPSYERLAYALLRQFVRALKGWRARQQGDIVDTPKIDPPVLRSIPVSAKEEGLRGLFGYWKKQGTKKAKTIGEAERVIDQFTAIHGDLPARKIAKGHVVAFKDHQLDAGKSPATARKQLGLLAAIFELAHKNEKLERNPADGVEVPRTKGKKPRVSFSTESLRRIFSSPVFTQQERPRAGAGEASFWLPLIALFTGARREEIAQLLISDIKEQEGFYFFDFTDEGEAEGDTANEKSLKNEASRRPVPIHPELVRLGILAYVDEMKKQGHLRLFPLVTSKGVRQKADSWGKWWGRYLRTTIGITDKRNTFHSFRHSFKDACRECGIAEDMHDRLTGHSDGRVSRTYGGDTPLIVALHEAVRKIRYRGLDLSHIKQWKAA